MQILTSSGLWEEVCNHLLPKAASTEHAAFLFGAYEAEQHLIRVIDYELLFSRDFTIQEMDYLELKDPTRARLIKRAHDRKACLIEMHSHPGSAVAAFSRSDVIGLRETVPHMLWRLKGQPYAAIVVADSSFDALAWYPGTSAPVSVDRISITDQVLKPTNLSVGRWR